MELPLPNIHFQASLSNGQTILEGKGDYQWLPGQPSPWQRLLKYAVSQRLDITSLSLITPDGRTHTLPPVGRKAKFLGYNGRSDADLPYDYEVKRYVSRSMNVTQEAGETTMGDTELSEFYTIAEVMYPAFVLQLWIDEQDPKHSWTVIKHN